MSLHQSHRIAEAASVCKNSWIHLFSPRPDAKVRLFCFPYSGAGASIFFSWPGIVDEPIEICPVRLPGREIRLNEPLFTDLFPLVKTLGEALIPYLNKPFAFFGHSMGSLVAFELARHLRKSYGPMPGHLFVSGFSAPHLYEAENPIHNLPEPEFLLELRELNGMSEELLRHEELMQLLVPILRADFRVCETYVYQTSEPLPCPITAFGGLQDSSVGQDKLEAWRLHTKSSFSLRMFPGDHFYLNAHRTFLLKALIGELKEHGGLLHEIRSDSFT